MEATIGEQKHEVIDYQPSRPGARVVPHRPHQSHHERVWRSRERCRVAYAHSPGPSSRRRASAPGSRRYMPGRSPVWGSPLTAEQPSFPAVFFLLCLRMSWKSEMGEEGNVNSVICVFPKAFHHSTSSPPRFKTSRCTRQSCLVSHQNLPS